MPIAETSPAAALTFDAAVNRALSRRLSDTPYPHSGTVAAANAPRDPDAAPGPEADTAAPAG